MFSGCVVLLSCAYLCLRNPAQWIRHLNQPAGSCSTHAGTQSRQLRDMPEPLWPMRSLPVQYLDQSAAAVPQLWAVAPQRAGGQGGGRGHLINVSFFMYNLLLQWPQLQNGCYICVVWRMLLLLGPPWGCFVFLCPPPHHPGLWMKVLPEVACRLSGATKVMEPVPVYGARMLWKIAKDRFYIHIVYGFVLWRAILSLKGKTLREITHMYSLCVYPGRVTTQYGCWQYCRSFGATYWFHLQGWNE